MVDFTTLLNLYTSLVLIVLIIGAIPKSMEIVVNRKKLTISNESIVSRVIKLADPIWLYALAFLVPSSAAIAILAYLSNEPNPMSFLIVAGVAWLEIFKIHCRNCIANLDETQDEE